MRLLPAQAGPGDGCHRGPERRDRTTRIRAAEDLADELSELTEEERSILKASVSDLVRDGPRTEIAAVRTKKIFPKIGNFGADLLKKAKKFQP